MKRKIILTTKKLLAFAKTGKKPEHTLARERAHALMEKYKFEVSDTMDHREIMRGVAGVYWKQLLLVAIAKVYRCRVLRSTDPNKPRAVLAGLPEDVANAKGMYAHTAFALIMNAWTSCEVVDTLSDSGDTKAARASWFRFFFNSAAESIANRLKAAVPPEPTGPPRPPPTGPTQEQKDAESEMEVMTEELKQLIALVGSEWSARALVDAAVYVGKGMFEALDWKWRQKIYGHKLAKNSEAFPPPPPPPPPNRFSFLDFSNF